MIKLGKIYQFSNDNKNWTRGLLTRVDNHVHPYCANYTRYNYIKGESNND